MSTTRISSGFDDPIINERKFLNEFLKNDGNFPQVKHLGECKFQNEVSEAKIGKYRTSEDRKSVTADLKLIGEFTEKSKLIPNFLVAGPRKTLFHNPKNLIAAIVTTGGLAPGLNSVINSIVKRHYNTYELDASSGSIRGIYESYLGACNLQLYARHLTAKQTELWLEKGGSMLGIRRYYPDDGNTLKRKQAILTKKIAEQMRAFPIKILYVIGGDGSLSTAHEIAKRVKNDNISVVGIPKTMDNDVFWVSESFGFKTAVENTTHIINTINSEAESSRRVGLIEIFGAESGFVAAHSALASGHVDLVLVPEEFQRLTKEEYEATLVKYVEHLKEKIRKLPNSDENPHAVVVLAEGVAKILTEKKVKVNGILIDEEKDSCGFLILLKNYLKGSNLIDKYGNKIDVFFNRPRHYIRATPANSHDQVYCDQLGAMAVDSALAGYTDFMISQWHNTFVLVPLELVADRHKRISPQGVFWKQVINNTGQPYIEYQNGNLCESEM